MTTSAAHSDDSARDPSTATGHGRSVAAQTISGVAVTGDGARVDARKVEVRRASAMPDITGRLSNLPRPPVRSFVGRDDELTGLRMMLDSGSGVISQAVHGLGGVGKSELALQFAHANRERYAVRWWVNCETPETVTADLAALTTRVNADLLLTATPAEAADWAVGWLQNQSRWLVILDNVEQLADVEELLGQLDTGHMLITTRRDLGWERLVDGCVRLDLLDRASAVRLLIERTGQTDELSAAVLADELGYLPLALQQAAGYLRQTRIPMATYLDRLRSQPERFLATTAEGDRAERAVAQVWLVTLDRLRTERPAAIDLLRLLACFAPDDVPRSLLVTEPDQEAVVDQELATLASYSLIALTDQTASMHRLLQLVIRTQAETAAAANFLTPRAGHEILGRAVELLSNARPRGNPSADVEAWPRWTELAPHIDAVVSLMPDDKADLDFAFLAGQLGFFYSTQGRYEPALIIARRVLAITETALPDGDRQIALRLDNLAISLGDLGRHEEALPLQRRALAISEAALPEGHLSIGVRLNNLAITLADLGRHEEALPLTRRALAISEAALPEGHRNIAVRLDNLAYMLKGLRRYEEALPLRRRALAISEAALPEGHPSMAVRLDNLGVTLAVLGRHEEALPLQRRALAISEAALPEGHPDIVLRLNNLVVTLAALGQHVEAQSLRQRASEGRTG